MCYISMVFCNAYDNVFLKYCSISLLFEEAEYVAVQTRMIRQETLSSISKEGVQGDKQETLGVVG